MTHIYQSLPSESRIKIFQQVQAFLIKNYPSSEFIVRRNFLTYGKHKMLETLLKLYKEFNGSIYNSPNCIVFYKIFNVSGEGAEGLADIYKKYDKPSDEEGNTVFIVFATYNEGADIPEILASELQGQIKNIAFSREGKFKIYSLERFIKKARLS